MALTQTYVKGILMEISEVSNPCTKTKWLRSLPKPVLLKPLIFL